MKNILLMMSLFSFNVFADKLPLASSGAKVTVEAYNKLVEEVNKARHNELDPLGDGSQVGYFPLDGSLDNAMGGNSLSIASGSSTPIFVPSVKGKGLFTNTQEYHSTLSQSITNGTIMLWLKIDSHAGPNPNVISLGTHSSNSGFGLWFKAGSTVFRSRVNTSYANDTGFHYDRTMYRHVTLVHDNGSNRLYVDGFIYDSLSLGQARPSSLLLLGNRIGGAEPVNATYDNIRIFNRVLTKEEIKKIYDVERRQN